MHATISNGKGPEVVLIHGNSMAQGVWREQMQDPMLGGMRLTALDLPGHGSSAPYPSGRPYSVDAFAEDVAAHVRTMQDPILVGHSLGGHICMRTLALVPGIRGLLVFGSPPLSCAADLGLSFLPNPALGKAFQAHLSEEEAMELAKAYSWEGCPLIPDMARMILGADPRVRGDLGLEMASGIIPDEQAMIRTAQVPVCVVHGASDPFLAAPYFEELAGKLFWRGKVHTIEGAGHCPHVQSPAAFNAILNQFVSEL
ncbi:MAG TPA: alpha/beta hydrolase [Flavobacteriales bacterium]|nr:alpha/beta hydrolase [Flavobacteriales bacterium]